MKSKSLCLLLLFIFLLGFTRCTDNCVGSKAKVVDLKCRGLVTPEGIDEAVFSWKNKEYKNLKKNDYKVFTK